MKIITTERNLSSQWYPRGWGSHACGRSQSWSTVAAVEKRNRGRSSIHSNAIAADQTTYTSYI